MKDDNYDVIRSPPLPAMLSCLWEMMDLRMLYGLLENLASPQRGKYTAMKTKMAR